MLRLQLALIRKYRLDILLALPGLLLLAIFLFAPLMAMFGISFTRWPIIGSPTLIGIKNYYNLFHDNIFLKSLKNTLFYALITVPSITGFSFLLALLLRNITRGKEFFKALYVFPIVVALVSTASIWKGMYFFFGPLNQLLSKLGLNPVEFLSAGLVIPSLCLVLIWRDIGYYSLFFLAGFDAIPSEILEAAIVDGASPFQRFRYIVWPMMKPITLLVTVLVTIGSFMIFTLVYVMTSGGPAYSSEALLNYIYDSGWRDFRMGYAAAAAVIYFIVLFGINTIERMALERE